MKLNRIKLLAISTCLATLSSFAASETAITGAGSSFIYPALSKWAQAYEKVSHVQVNYQDIGSGGGIQQLSDKTIDFGASDMPLPVSELNKKQWVQFPMVSGGIVMVVNLQGIANNQLTLDGPTLAKIYMNQITKWNDPAIKKLNPGLSLPNSPIITVHRADGSGTTFNFTNYLGKIKEAGKPIWTVGSSTVVQWPGAFSLGAKGNAGIAAQVQKIPGSIGYVEFSYANDNALNMVKLVNQAGKVVKASQITFASAAKNAQWTAKNGFGEILTNEPGATAWPIVATTFVMLAKKPSHPIKNKVAMQFFSWCFKQADMVKPLGYVGMPNNVVSKIKADIFKQLQ
jgi:phosphate transport system substrate-binding protein